MRWIALALMMACTHSRTAEEPKEPKPRYCYFSEHVGNKMRIECFDTFELCISSAFLANNYGVTRSTNLTVTGCKEHDPEPPGE